MIKKNNIQLYTLVGEMSDDPEQSDLSRIKKLCNRESLLQYLGCILLGVLSAASLLGSAFTIRGMLSEGNVYWLDLWIVGTVLGVLNFLLLGGFFYFLREIHLDPLHRYAIHRADCFFVQAEVKEGWVQQDRSHFGADRSVRMYGLVEHPEYGTQVILERIQHRLWPAFRSNEKAFLPFKVLALGFKEHPHLLRVVGIPKKTADQMYLHDKLRTSLLEKVNLWQMVSLGTLVFPLYWWGVHAWDNFQRRRDIAVELKAIAFSFLVGLGIFTLYVVVAWWDGLFSRKREADKNKKNKIRNEFFKQEYLLAALMPGFVVLNGVVVAKIIQRMAATFFNTKIAMNSLAGIGLPIGICLLIVEYGLYFKLRKRQKKQTILSQRRR